MLFLCNAQYLRYRPAGLDELLRRAARQICHGYYQSRSNRHLLSALRLMSFVFAFTERHGVALEGDKQHSFIFVVKPV